MAPTSMKTYMEFFREDRPSTVSSRQHNTIELLLTTLTQGP